MNRSKLLIVAAILLILLCGCDKNDSTENTRSSLNESSAAASSVSEKMYLKIPETVQTLT